MFSLTQRKIKGQVLDNSFQKIEEKENKDIEDIQFEEVVDIDEIQKKLQERNYEITPETELPESPPIEEQKNIIINEVQAVMNNKLAPADSNSKKYVIYIDPDNINFMENLSVNERREVINKILKDKNALDIKTKEINAKKRFLSHAILACFTFVIGFPLMFAGVNKAMMATIDNYQQAKENFMKLYKEQGKIKMKENGVVRNIKY